MSGIQNIPIRFPDEYSASFFERLFRETLSLADVRNAIAGTGISITGESSENATIAASQDVQDLLAANVLTLNAAGLDNSRQLIGKVGQISVNEVGLTAVISVDQFGLTLDRIVRLPDLSVLASQDGGGFSTVDVIQSTEDNQMVARVDDTITFTPFYPPQLAYAGIF